MLREKDMDKHYEASEAIKKLRIPRSTFFALVRAGEIPKVELPLRKRALYPKEEIDRLAAERAEVLHKLKQNPERLRFMIASKEDFRQIAEIDRMLFQEETWMSPEELQERLPYNPEVTHVLKDLGTSTVLGYISMSPMKQDTLEKLVKLEIDETCTKPQDFTAYTPDHPLDCYIISMAARPGIMQHYYAGKLIYTCKDYFIGLLERGITIRRIYTIATTKEADRIAKSLHFTPLATTNEWESQYEDFRHPYVLDLETKESKSRLVSEYLTHKRNIERRKKRHKKEQKTNRGE